MKLFLLDIALLVAMANIAFAIARNPHSRVMWALGLSGAAIMVLS